VGEVGGWEGAGVDGGLLQKFGSGCDEFLKQERRGREARGDLEKGERFWMYTVKGLRALVVVHVNKGGEKKRPDGKKFFCVGRFSDEDSFDKHQKTNAPII
jgi:hypothetical protein